MYLREIAIYADTLIAEGLPSGFVGRFHRETCCISELYEHVLGKSFPTPDTVKVNLTFTNDTARARTIRQLLNITDASWLFDFSEYSKLDDLNKKLMILDALQTSLLWISEKRGWSSNNFVVCYEEIIHRKLQFEGWSKKSWSSPNPKYKVKIGFVYGLSAIEFYIGVFDRGGRELGRKLLGAVLPERGMAHTVLKGAGKWNKFMFEFQISDTHFRLPKSWTADIKEFIRS